MKPFSFLLLLAVSLIFSGCGSTGANKSAATVGSSPAKRLGLTQSEYDAMNSLFSALGEALEAKKPKEVSGHFDVLRMLDACEEQGMNIAELGISKPVLAMMMRVALGPQLVQHSEMMGWTECEIRRVQFLKGREEVMVRTRTRDKHGILNNIVWWLALRDGKWRIFDYEEVLSSLRVSIVMAVAMAEGRSALAWKDQFLQMIGIAEAVVGGDLDAADEVLEDIRDTKFPPMIESARWLMTAAVRVGQGKFREALKACDLAESYQPQITGQHLMRLSAYTGLGKYKEAIEHGKKYIAAVGPDADAFYGMAVAYELLGNRRQAEQFYLKGIADDPQGTDCLAGFAVLLPEKRKKEFLPHFFKLKNLDKGFETLADCFVEVEDTQALRVLLDAYRAQSPNKSVIEKYEQAYKKLTTPAKQK